MNLRTLSDSEFLRYANNQLDEFTTSEIERELLRRLEDTDTELFEVANESELTASDLSRLVEALEGFTVSEVTEMLGVLLEASIGVKHLTSIVRLLEHAGITEPDECKTMLELADKFRKIANDAGDIFTRLHTLTEETQGE